MAKNSNTGKVQMNKQQEAYKGIHKVVTSGGGPVAQRTCLRCGKLFDSIGRGNRFCPACHGPIARVKVRTR
ncbi:MAG: hypothetical protein GWP14_07305 [Actinobacteria bacterium]|nr:hypothetical protein [Actinomycetota bacterium]